MLYELTHLAETGSTLGRAKALPPFASVKTPKGGNKMNRIHILALAFFVMLSFEPKLQAISYITYEYHAGLHSISGAYESSHEEGYIEGRFRVPYKGSTQVFTGQPGIAYYIPNFEISARLYSDTSFLTATNYKGPAVLYVHGAYTPTVDLAVGNYMWLGWDNTWLVDESYQPAFLTDDQFNVTKISKMIGFIEGEINNYGFFSDGGLTVSRVYSTPDVASTLTTFMTASLLFGALRILGGRNFSLKTSSADK